jgi:hypothetical protein
MGCCIDLAAMFLANAFAIGEAATGTASRQRLRGCRRPYTTFMRFGLSFIALTKTFVFRTKPVGALKTGFFGCLTPSVFERVMQNRAQTRFAVNVNIL